jgi:CheY-like chemotaxis protein
VKNTVYRLVTCSQPENAVSLIEKEHPDIVILDVMMKSLDGWQLYQQVRSSSFGKRPVIICTVLAQEQLARTLGADDLMRKPISRDDFLSTLHRQWVKNES